MEGKSLDVKKERIEKLKALMPEVFNEVGEIDFEKLKLTLGESVNTQNERYVLNWAGKSDSFKVLQTPTTATLAPDKEESINFDTTENIFIEGENLEVLKVLQKSYFGKIKMIYIDPPYNTGNDSFIYPDKFSESKDEYLKRIGEKDEEGFLLKEGLFRKNSKENGQYHSNWLSMMYPRLFLARNLLKEDGVIFVSIDDNEVHNLKMVMNEIFGEENFVGMFIWHSRQNVDSRSLNGVSIDHEYVICFSKIPTSRLKGKEINKEKYSNPDKDPRGPWMSSPMDGIATKDKRPNLHFDILNKLTGLSYKPSQESGWRFQRSTIEKLIIEDRIIWPKNPNSKPRFKRYLNELENDFTGFSSILKTDFTSQGTKELRNLFEIETLKFPKPTSLIKLMIAQGLQKEEIVLDFFAGSGTTAKAVIELNHDRGNRKFILVQLPEKTSEDSEAYKAGYKSIADICKERIRRVIKNLTPGPSPKERGEERLFSEEQVTSEERLTSEESLNSEEQVTTEEQLPFGSTQSFEEKDHRSPGYITTDPVTYKNLKPFTKENRKNQTKAEGILWEAIRNRKLGSKFRRQHAIEKFIVDFVCLEEILVIEIDGGYHDSKDQAEYDKSRTEGLNSLGYKELRFRNEEVINNLEEVLNTIRHFLKTKEIKYSNAQSSHLLWRGAGDEVDNTQSAKVVGGEVDNKPGFKVFKLKHSNFKLWRSDVIENEDDLEKQLDAFEDPIKKETEEINIVYELLLKLGYDLNVDIQKQAIFIDGEGKFKDGEYVDEVSGNFQWWSIDSGKLVIVTDAVMPVSNLINYFKEENIKPEKVICLDKIFDGSDEEKTNLVLQMKDAGVEFKTV